LRLEKGVRSIQAHRVILRPKGLDPLANIAIIDVAAVNLEEVAQRRWIVSGTLK
jgi:hypothetical protein